MFEKHWFQTFAKTLLYFRAVEVYEAELVEPTAELGTKWLEIEFGRNCRHLQNTIVFTKIRQRQRRSANQECLQVFFLERKAFFHTGPVGSSGVLEKLPESS